MVSYRRHTRAWGAEHRSTSGPLAVWPHIREECSGRPLHFVVERDEDCVRRRHHVKIVDSSSKSENTECSESRRVWQVG